MKLKPLILFISALLFLTPTLSAAQIQTGNPVVTTKFSKQTDPLELLGALLSASLKVVQVKITALKKSGMEVSAAEKIAQDADVLLQKAAGIQIDDDSEDTDAVRKETKTTLIAARDKIVTAIISLRRTILLERRKLADENEEAETPPKTVSNPTPKEPLATTTPVIENASSTLEVATSTTFAR